MRRTAATRLTLDALDLQVSSATLDGETARVVVDAKAQSMIVTPASPVTVGRHILRLRYSGRILQRPAGLFAVDSRDARGTPARTLVTQLEPADGRRLAPMFDAPAQKAVFAFSVLAPRSAMAVSNMPAASDAPAADGFHLVRFAPTPPMSSYLLFLAVGDLERVSRKVDGVELGVVTPRGQAGRGRFALETAAAVLRDYDAWFGVRFPLPKLDLVVAPGEVGAAMENWGAMLFGASSVLIDPKESTDADRRAAALLIAHEIAHQWFGDLVTMRWWSDLWLNEAFASWRSVKALEDLHPSWRSWLAAMVDREEAMSDDALPTAHPIVRTIMTPGQAAQAFDATTYEKGQAVVRMLEAYAGKDAFREGVRRYMRRYAYRNTDGADLWREIDRASHRDVSSVAAAFTRQAGLPLVRVDDGATPGLVRLTQSRFTDAEEPSAGRWLTPLAATGLRRADVLVGDVADEPVDGGRPLVVNLGALAYARIDYSPRNFAALTSSLATLAPIDQITAIDDAWALGLAGRRPLSDVLELIDRLPGSADPVVWRRVDTLLAQADDLHDDGPARDALKRWSVRKIQPVHARLGWEPRAGDAPDDATLRASSLLLLARFGDEAVLREARRRFDTLAAGDRSSSPEVRRTVLRIISRHADPSSYEALLRLARREVDVVRRESLYSLLGRATDPGLARRTLDLALSDEIPADTGPAMVLTVAEQHPGLAWRFAVAHRTALMAQLDSVGMYDFLPEIAGDSFELSRADEVLSDAAANYPPEDREPAQKAAATVRLNARVRASRLVTFDRWIAAHG